jgi:hypothetical protein
MLEAQDSMFEQWSHYHSVNNIHSIVGFVIAYSHIMLNSQKNINYVAVSAASGIRKRNNLTIAQSHALLCNAI